MLQVDSWDSLGITMTQLPTLHNLMITERKVNSFIDCYVAVRRITSIYDLERAICKCESVNNFEELGLGPLLRHPLVIHYFSLGSGITQVFKIASDEIIQLLGVFLDVSKSKAINSNDEFLDFIAKKRSVECRELFGIRISNLRMHITAIQEARKSEESTLDNYLQTSRSKRPGKRRVSSLKKKKLALDKCFCTTVQPIKPFTYVYQPFHGKPIKFMSSSSDDEGSNRVIDNDQNSNIVMGRWSNPSSQFVRGSERVSSCPDKSSTEEMAGLSVKGDMQGDTLANRHHKNDFIEPPEKKRKSEYVTSTMSPSSAFFKKKKIEVDATQIKIDNTTKLSNNMVGDLSITNDTLQMFVTTWKETSWEHKVAEGPCLGLGSVQKMEEFRPQCSSSHSPIDKSLCNIYPGLRGFFIGECGVHEAPPLRNYIQILRQLKSVTLPSQAADKIFQVFLKWADGLRSGLLSVEDVKYLKECLSKLEFAVLPTVQDKWVSLHPSFGLVCWCDDKKLEEEFKHSDNLDFLYFGELTMDHKEMQEKISFLMKNLGIPAISEVVTREEIYYGPADCCLKESLVNHTFPYAQRYVHKLHNDRYVRLKQSGFDMLNHLKVIVVEKLFYRNVIKDCGSVSKERVECSCLLRGNTLYTIQEADHHSLFMELSSLLFDGTSELHLANFLHMITTMAESGSSEEQIEFFVLNSQKVPKLPDEEPVWALSSVSSPVEAEKSLPSEDHVRLRNGKIVPRRKSGVSSKRPPVHWKTAPGFNYASVNPFKAEPAQISGISDDSEGINAPPYCAERGSVAVDLNIIGDPPESSMSLMLHENENLEDQPRHDLDPAAFSFHIESDPVSFGEDMDEYEYLEEEAQLSSPGFSKRGQLGYGSQLNETGRLGEFLACKYFAGKFGKTAVRWVNEDNETGLPYDVVIGEDSSKEFIEVKATRFPSKAWFTISMKEWQFAIDKGKSFSIAFVAIKENNVARITIFKDPAKLCQLGQLKLAVLIRKQQQKQSSVIR